MTLLALLDRLPPVCFYRIATGHLCVFCGMTHAVAHALRGEWAAATAANPAWLPILGALALIAVRPRRRTSWLFVGALVAATALRW